MFSVVDCEVKIRIEIDYYINSQNWAYWFRWNWAYPKPTFNWQELQQPEVASGKFRSSVASAYTQQSSHCSADSLLWTHEVKITNKQNALQLNNYLKYILLNKWYYLSILSLKCWNRILSNTAQRLQDCWNVPPTMKRIHKFLDRCIEVLIVKTEKLSLLQG